MNLHILRRLEAVVREESDDLVQPVQWRPKARRQFLELGPRQISVAFLDQSELLDEHRDPRTAK